MLFRRTLWTLLSLIFIALLAEWVRSYRHLDALDYYRTVPWLVDQDAFHMFIGVGVITVFHDRVVGIDTEITNRRPVPAHWDLRSSRIDPAKPRDFIKWSTGRKLKALYAFGIENSRHNPDMRSKYFTVSMHMRSMHFPIWIIILPIGILLGTKIKRVLRLRQRVRSGLCVHCGYDLRASSDRCPECGSAVSSL